MRRRAAGEAAATAVRKTARALVLALAVGGSASAIAPARAVAQDFRALARVLPERSSLSLSDDAGELVLGLSQAVPYRVATLDNPRRLVMDFREVGFDGLPVEAFGPDARDALRFGRLKPGWTRLVLALPAPLLVREAGMRTDPATGSAVIRVSLARGTEQAFAALVREEAQDPRWTLPHPADTPRPRSRQRGERKLVVMLDPGHGGVDPGAQRDGIDEADLMLDVARQLKERLVRDAGMVVYLTRERDEFVSLQRRVTMAREKQADVFISLHADALAQGRASGTTVYTLSDRASDRASALLAERLDREDLLAGVDLQEQDDLIAGVLMDMVRKETAPRSDLLADLLVSEIRKSSDHLHKRPRLEAGFSVLRAPDIPSVLIELGFMSDEKDLARISDAAWRSRLIDGIQQALQKWLVEDAAQVELIRQ
ncbi:N-acetylmuramoyl-L-alanine amidase [Brevirhabdus sp.]|uniref:N-acetylmuramoyl-L-alanine amidase n=1 Tax=Brevirhabdus sp. TaxID=2004514 RepID=UPI0040583EA0